MFLLFEFLVDRPRQLEVSWRGGGGYRDSQVLALAVIPIPVFDDTVGILHICTNSFGSWVNERLSHSFHVYGHPELGWSFGGDGGLANLGATTIGCLSVLPRGKNKIK